MRERTGEGLSLSRHDSWRVEINLPGFPKTEQAVKKLKMREAGAAFRDFFEDEMLFKDIEDTMKEFLKGQPTDELMASFRQELASFIFEQIAFSFLNGRIGKIGRLLGVDSEVLSPELMAKIVRMARPDLPTTSWRGLKQSKHGIKNPDGILLRVTGDQTVIWGVCEYSLSRDNVSDLSDYKKDQIKHFASGQIIDDILVNDSIQKRLGQFLSDVTRSRFPAELSVDRTNWRIIYVRPRRSLKHRQDYLIRDRLIIVNAPFPQAKFMKIVDGLITDVQSSLAQESVSAD